MSGAIVSSDPVCSICGKCVPLQTSKTDENGKAVHEECYVSKVTSKNDVIRNRKDVMGKAAGLVLYLTSTWICLFVKLEPEYFSVASPSPANQGRVR